MPGRTFAMATPAILLGFLPLNHLMGRMTLLRVSALHTPQPLSLMAAECAVFWSRSSSVPVHLV